jgi:hypothetical protein
MMHADQIYTVRQLQHQDLLAEAERERVKRDFVGIRAAGSRAWLAKWLRRLSTHRTDGITLTGRAE